jgi:hypothetical protein
MVAYWRLWIEVLDLGLESQRVIAMRLARIAAGGGAADAECQRMVSEKFAAAVAAQTAAAEALVGGKGLDAAARLALAPVRVAVRANHRRLSRAKRFDEMRLALRRLATRPGLAIGRILKLQARP